MLWICVHLPHLAIELQSAAEGMPAAICSGAGTRRVLIDCNASAQAAGIRPGMTIPAALLREPGLGLIERSAAAERRALRALAGWAQQFTSDVCLDPTCWSLWLEVRASLRYFNSLTRLYAQLRAGLVSLGHAAQYAIAPTLAAAALLAREEQALPVLNKCELRAALQPLPLTHLDVPAKIIEQLQTSGLSTIGALLTVAPAALARRFGTQLPDYLQRLLGEQPDIRSRHRSPRLYRRRFDFMEPVAALEGLLFPLRRCLQEFEGYLRGRDTAIQQLTIALRHRSGAESLLRLSTSAPLRDAVRLFALMREKLERTELSAPVTAIELRATRFVAPQITQGDFFDDQQRRNDSWTALLDKLRTRLGADAVRHLGLRDDHRPEHAWCIAHDGAEKAEQVAGTAACPLDLTLPDRPLWLLEPTPLASLPQLLGTPERIEAGWWAGADSSRDYYLARTAAGARWWLYRDSGNNRWYLQGLWA